MADYFRDLVRGWHAVPTTVYVCLGLCIVLTAIFLGVALRTRLRRRRLRGTLAEARRLAGEGRTRDALALYMAAEVLWDAISDPGAGPRDRAADLEILRCIWAEAAAVADDEATTGLAGDLALIVAAMQKLLTTRENFLFDRRSMRWPVAQKHAALSRLLDASRTALRQRMAACH